MGQTQDERGGLSASSIGRGQGKTNSYQVRKKRDEGRVVEQEQGHKETSEEVAFETVSDTENPRLNVKGSVVSLGTGPGGSAGGRHGVNG